MPKKGASKGGKARRRAKGGPMEEKRDLITRDDGQQYAKVLRMLGNGRLEAYCYDGVKRLGIIRGKMRKKMWVQKGDIILVALRDFQDEKCDIIHRYSPDEARTLKTRGELPETAVIGDIDAGEGEENDAAAGGGATGGGAAAAAAAAFEFDEDAEVGGEVDISAI